MALKTFRCVQGLSRTPLLCFARYLTTIFSKKNPQSKSTRARNSSLYQVKETNWAPVSEPGFLDFQIFRFSILEIFRGEIFLKNMLVRYRGINNKGVLERPWTKWRVLDAISTTLKCQFTGKCRKVDFLTPCTTKSAETLQVAPYGRCGHPGNP